jgi:hypothetical protein
MSRLTARVSPWPFGGALITRVVLLAVVSLSLVMPAEALTGSEWQRLTPASRAAYVDGVIDAWVGLVIVQESLGNKDAGITVFAEVVTCLRDRLIGHDKIVAAVEKYVEDQPGLRSKDMPDIVFVAIGPFCR